MRFPVFLDANALYPASLADTLLRLAEADVIRPHSSADVMEELERNLAGRIGIDRAQLVPHDLEAVHPDELLLDQLDLYPQAVEWALARQAAATARPSLTPLQLIENFERIRLTGFAAEPRRRMPSLSQG